MINQEIKNLIYDIREINQESERTKKTKLTEEQWLDRIRDWCTFYRRNKDIFVTDFLKINKIAYLQREMLLTMGANSLTMIVCSRELGKSHITSLDAICDALLYSNCKVVVTSATIDQANKIIEKKIKGVFCNPASAFYSPVLGQMVQDGYITFTSNKNTTGLIVNFGNGSAIEAFPCLPSARGERANVLIADEFVLLKKKDYDEIMHPMLANRDFGGRPDDYPDDWKEIFLSSAKKKTNWGWKKLKDCVTDHFKNKDCGFFIADIFTAVANGINTKKQLLTAKRNSDEFTFMQEYCNIWLGSGANSLFSYEDFEKNQILKKPFIPLSNLDYLSGIQHDYEFKDTDIRFMATDIAVAVGTENDKTAIDLGCFDTEKAITKLEYIESRNGMNSLEQAVLFKRLFYEYRCKYFVMDTTGIGNTIFDILTTETYDSERDVTYPAWTVCMDDTLQIVSNTVQNDKVQRTISNNAEEVIVPIVGTASINTELHLALRKNLREGKIKFLIDDGDAQVNFESDPYWVTKDTEEKIKLMSPFLQTRFTINESVSVEAEIKDNGNIKTTEGRSATKDLFMALDYFNYFAEKLAIKYKKDEENDDEDFDIGAWSFLATI